MKASSLVPTTGGRSSTLALLRAIKQVAIATFNMFLPVFTAEYLAFLLYISFIWIVVWMMFFPVTHQCYLASRISPISSGINEKKQNKTKKTNKTKGAKSWTLFYFYPSFFPTWMIIFVAWRYYECASTGLPRGTFKSAQHRLCHPLHWEQWRRDWVWVQVREYKIFSGWTQRHNLGRFNNFERRW